MEEKHDYVVMVDLAFLGVPVTATDAKAAETQALQRLAMVGEFGMRSVKAVLVEESVEGENDARTE